MTSETLHIFFFENVLEFMMSCLQKWNKDQKAFLINHMKIEKIIKCGRFLTKLVRCMTKDKKMSSGSMSQLTAIEFQLHSLFWSKFPRVLKKICWSEVNKKRKMKKKSMALDKNSYWLEWWILNFRQFCKLC